MPEQNRDDEEVRMDEAGWYRKLVRVIRQNVYDTVMIVLILFVAVVLLCAQHITVSSGHKSTNSIGSSVVPLKADQTS